MGSSFFDGLQMPHELACDFFALFARFEYALKEGGYHRNQYGFAAPAWRRFSEAVGKTMPIETGSSLAAAIDYLNHEPPKIQLDNGQWEALGLEGGTLVARAIDAANRTRNNLFHGGKHMPGSLNGRDEQLVRASMEVLIACLDQDQKVKSVFDHRS